MPRGRFSSRGTPFRGSRGSGDSWRSSSRGGFGSRGRSSWYKESPGVFESRSKYGGGMSGPGERYSMRGGRADDSYPKYNRTATSSRRSHEGSYGAGGGPDYSSRYGYNEERSGYQETRGYREERRSSGFRDHSREEYSHRKTEPLDTSLRTPSVTRHTSSPRGSFRGRGTRVSRGYPRLLARRAEYIARKKAAVLDAYRMRKKLLARSQQARLLKLRRIRERAAAAKRASIKAEVNDTKDMEDISNDEKDVNWDDDETEKEKEEEEEEEVEDEEEEEEEGEVKENKSAEKEKSKAKYKKVSRTKTEEKIDTKNESNKATGTSAKEEIQEDEKEVDSSTKDAKGDSSTVVKEETESHGPDEPRNKHSFRGRPFIRLSCPQCFTHVVTFKEYADHLYGLKHSGAMRKLSLRHKQTLARMRMKQRQKQRIVEEDEEIRGTLTGRTNFCPICKLNYMQPKLQHQSSESHRAMKRFLLPFCTVCQLRFKSPMQYENHICSLEHIKRKARLREIRSAREKDEDGDLSDDKDINMENFMILDSVGTVDETVEDGENSGDGTANKEKKDDVKSKNEVTPGVECIKLVEVYFCELCRIYLPRLDQRERAIQIHCKSHPHLRRYMRYRDEILRKKAEQARHGEDKGKENKMESEVSTGGEKVGCENSETEMLENPKGQSQESVNINGDVQESENEKMEVQEGDTELDPDLDGGIDDKLWADVDKDLGELLREVEPEAKSSDEDEDSHGDRYDRFRYSEKGSVIGPAENEASNKLSSISEEEKKSATKPDADGSKKSASSTQN